MAEKRDRFIAVLRDQHKAEKRDRILAESGPFEFWQHNNTLVTVPILQHLGFDRIDILFGITIGFPEAVGLLGKRI